MILAGLQRRAACIQHDQHDTACLCPLSNVWLHAQNHCHHVHCLTCLSQLTSPPQPINDLTPSPALLTSAHKCTWVCPLWSADFKFTFTVASETDMFVWSAAPHMGSAYSTLAADVIARYQRLAQREVILITGTDEHGEKIAAAAAAQGVEPQQHCDGIAAKYQALWQKVSHICHGLSDFQT